MDINLKDDIDIEENIKNDEIITDIEDKPSSEERIDNNKNNSSDNHMEMNLLKNNSTKNSSLASSTWGTLLMMLILAVTSVGSYAPLKSYIFPSFTRLPDHWQLEQYTILVLSIGGISLLLLTIIAFAIPYSHQKKASIVKSHNRTFIELKIFIWFLFFGLILLILDAVSFALVMTNLISTPCPGAKNRLLPNRHTITFILYILFTCASCIKYLHTGFVSGFIKTAY